MDIEEIEKTVSYIIGAGDIKRRKLMMNFIMENLYSDTIEKLDLDEDVFNNDFLVYIYKDQLVLSHYICDTDIYLTVGDCDLDVIIRTAAEHLKECKGEEEEEEN